MTTRYVLMQPDIVHERFSTCNVLRWKPQYNMRPETVMPTISLNANGQREIVGRMLGFLPPWVEKQPAQIFPVAKAETVYELPTFRESFQRNRCLLVADGFYVWDGGQPYFVRLSARQLFAVAAIATTNMHFKQQLKSFAVLTTIPNATIAQVHHRMPVILRRGDEDAYLDSRTSIADLKRMGYPDFDAQFDVVRVSKKLNQARYNAPSLICAAPEIEYEETPLF